MTCSPHWNSITLLLTAFLMGGQAKAVPLPEQAPPPLPRPVASFGAASTPDGSVFVYGGHAGKSHQYHRDDVHGDLHRWRPGDAEWTLLAQGEPAQGAALVIAGDRLLRIGGMAARNAPDEDNDLWSSATVTAFSILDGSAEPLPDMPHGRSSHDAVLAGRFIHVLGGWTLSGSTDDGATRSDWHDTRLVLNLDDLEAGWQSHPQPFKRRGMAAAVLNDQLLVIGGMDSKDQVLRTVSILDLATGIWSEGPDVPEGDVGGFGFAAVTHEDRLFASGAAGQLLQWTQDAWTPIAKLKHPRFFHRLVPAGPGQLIAIGGQGRPRGKPGPEFISLPAPTPAGTVYSDWPQFQGPRGDGTTPESGWDTAWPADGPKESWRRELGIGLTSFAVTGDRVFTAGNDGNDLDTLWCLNLDDGAVLWKHESKAVTAIHAMPIVPYGPAATPTVADGRVFHLLRDGQLICLDAGSGAPVWSKHLVDDLGGVLPVYGYSSSPSVVEGRLYLDLGQAAPDSNPGSTACLDAATGALIWQTGGGQAGYATPRLIPGPDHSVLVLFKGEALELRHPDDGTLLARFETTTRDYCNCATPVVLDDLFFISHTGGEGARALRWQDDKLEPVWTDRTLGLLFQSGLPWNGHLLAFNDQLRGSNELRLLDLQTGESTWTSAEITRGSGLLCDDDHAIYLTNQGELLLARISKEGIEILHRVQALGGKSYIQPVLSQHRLLCRNNQGQVVCYDLRR